jgi:hypothetical protein
LPGDKASHRIADRHSFKRVLIDMRGMESVFYRLAGQVLHAAVKMFGETCHTCANKGNLSHRGIPPWTKIVATISTFPLVPQGELRQYGRV